MTHFTVTIAFYQDNKIVAANYNVSVPKQYRGIEATKTLAIYNAATQHGHDTWVAASATEA